MSIEQSPGPDSKEEKIKRQIDDASSTENIVNLETERRKRLDSIETIGPPGKVLLLDIVARMDSGGRFGANVGDENIELTVQPYILDRVWWHKDEYRRRIEGALERELSDAELDNIAGTSLTPKIAFWEDIMGEDSEKKIEAILDELRAEEQEIFSKYDETTDDE